MKKDKNKKKDVKIRKEEKKRFNFLKIVFIICTSIILIELLIMLIMYLVNEHKINYLDTVNNMKMVDNGYVVAGSSNYRYSKYNDLKTYKYYTEEAKAGYQKIVAEQAKLVKYDNDMDIIWEKTFDGDYDSVFYDVIKVEDGYIAVGSYVYEYEQLELKTRDGLIVKYDDAGNYKWFKNYQILGDTEFFKVIDVNDGFIAIGQSIYENMEIGNHDMGGGIVVKFDYDGEVIWKNNFGGNKSGNFNDIVVVSDGYILCGKDGANYGMLVKVDKKGNILWHYSTLDVATTDNVGFTAMELYNNKLYIASSLNVSSKKDDQGNPIYQFDACVYVYDLNGKYVKKYKIGGSKDERFNDLIVDDNGIIAVGHTLSTDMFESDKIANQTGIIVKFDFDGNIISSDYYGGKNYDVLSSIIKTDKNYLISGYSNSFGNEKDFEVVFNEYKK